MKPIINHPRATLAAVAVTTITLLALAACGGATKTGTTKTTATTTAAASKTAAGATTAGGAVLPVSSNPIKNTSTNPALKIDKVNVEDNADPATGKGVPDHLEIALSNTGTAAIGGIEIYYSFTDTKTGKSESYYTKLPADFTIEASGKRVAHFDSTGQPDHFPVNRFDIYRTSKNPIEVKVTVSATDAAVQETTILKAAGGAETAD